MDKLRKLFASNDKDNSGSLDIDEFYEMFSATKNPFGDALFRLVNLDGDGEFLSFSEFVQVVTTYCLFGPNEILRFAFSVVDEDQSGFVSLEELDNLASWLHKGGPANLNTAILKIKEKYDKGDGNLSFETFKKIYREFPFIFYPAFRLQEGMMQTVFGQKWWDKKRKELDMVKEDEAPTEPSILSVYFPSIFPPKIASKEDTSQSAEKEEYVVFGGGVTLPPPGPELRAYRESMNDVAVIEEQMEITRKSRIKKSRDSKRAAEEKALKLKKERMQKRRARMLSAELLDPNSPPLLLTHQPASVVRLFGK